MGKHADTARLIQLHHMTAAPADRQPTARCQVFIIYKFSLQQQQQRTKRTTAAS